jgi:hypothetical protein
MWGLDMSKPGAQEYLNSILRLYASWDVDFIKLDDLTWLYRDAEVEGFRKAFDLCDREIVYSTSPGPTPLEKADHVSKNANMWRLLEDLWDRWDQLDIAFDICEAWNNTGLAGPGRWPDPDMLPLGHIALYGPVGEPRMSYYSQTEQYMMMTLWCIFNAPLMFGGNLPDLKTDPFTTSLLTNAEAMYVNQRGIMPRVAVSSKNFPVWYSLDPADTTTKFLGLFNRSSSPATVTVNWSNIGAVSGIVWDIWNQKQVGEVSGASFSAAIPSHGSGFYVVGKRPNLPVAGERTRAARQYINGVFKTTVGFSSLSVNNGSKAATADIYGLNGRRIASQAIGIDGINSLKIRTIAKEVYIIKMAAR